VIRVRVVEPAESPTWRDLRLRALADSPDAFGETLANASTRDETAWVRFTAPDPTRVVLFAEQAGAPIGMAVGRIAPEDPHRAHLYAMWVAPEARRSGAGRGLVDAVKRWARLAGASSLFLRVTERAPEAHAMYRTLGFVATGETEPLRDGSSITSYVLAAQLGPLVMGVVNVTPDSFSDGGVFSDPGAAIAHGIALLRDGADLIDVGGEATNPRAKPIDAAEELRRIEPVVRALVATGAQVSVDTTKAVVAKAAIAAGASIINDVSGGLFDPDMAGVLATSSASISYIVGHLRGRSLSEVFSAEAPVSWREVAAELGERLAALPASVRARAWVDPGIGFGKGPDPEGNLELLRHAGDLGRALGRPVVVGPSRKRFLRRIVESVGPIASEPTLDQLDAASVEASLAAVRSGARVVRVHNVALLRAALAVYTRI
jgi:dihydropteroate synthase